MDDGWMAPGWAITLAIARQAGSVAALGIAEGFPVAKIFLVIAQFLLPL